MITKRKINIPIFDYGLTIIIYDDWEEVKHLFDEGPEPKAITNVQYGYSILAVNYRYYNSIIHEAEHIKNAIWEYIGYRPMVDNDEVDAYLLAYIFKKILEVYNKHKE